MKSVATLLQTVIFGRQNPLSTKLKLISGALLLSAGLIVGGCDTAMFEHTEVTTVSVKFDGAREVDTGADVEINGLVVGKVASHSQDGGYTYVELALDADKGGVVQANGAAAIDSVKQRIILYNGEQPSEPIRSGGELTALNSPLDEAAWQAGRAVSVMQDSMRRFSTAMQGFFASEEWQRNKAKIEQSLMEFGEQSRETAQAIGDDVEAMLRDLESQSRAATERAEKQFDKLREALEELSEENKDELTASVNKLLESLRSALDIATKSSSNKSG